MQGPVRGVLINTIFFTSFPEFLQIFSPSGKVIAISKQEETTNTFFKKLIKEIKKLKDSFPFASFLFRKRTKIKIAKTFYSLFLVLEKPSKLVLKEAEMTFPRLHTLKAAPRTAENC